jgi:CRISPR system Cascade subunit CasA
VISRFNLLDEPFIPCLLPHGGRAELGLRQVLQQAPQIREIVDPSPLVTTCLHRLLLAILHRNFGPVDAPAWKQLWDAGRFDQAILSRYFDRWGNRFDLFSAKYPFYQTAGWRAKEPSSSKRLEHELVVGNIARHFHHVQQSTPRFLTPPQAARLAIVQQAYCMGGGKSETRYTSNGPLVKLALMMVRGQNLFQTLLLNMTTYPSATDGADDGCGPIRSFGCQKMLPKHRSCR